LLETSSPDEEDLGKEPFAYRLLETSSGKEGGMWNYASKPN
jgi:hypothetical protein